MPSPVIKPGDCCTPCGDVVIQQIPGPAGVNGANGTNGVDGISPFTTSTANFIMPAVNGNGTLNVVTNKWMVSGETIFLETGGYLQVLGLPIGIDTQAAVKNLGYPGNAAPATVIPSGSGVTVVGARGPIGIVPPLPVLSDISPTTTKGDLIVDDGANSPVASDVRFGSGADGQILHSKASTATGLIWAALDMSGALSSITGALPIANGGTGKATQQLALNALMPPAAAQGDMAKHNGTNWILFPKGTALQQIRVNAGGTDLEWFAGPSVTLLQRRSTSLATYMDVTSSIAVDDTPPGIGEGTEILTLAFTPLSSTSTLEISVFVPGLATKGTVALHNGGASAIAAVGATESNAVDCMATTAFVHSYAPGSTALITFSVRVGTNSGADHFYVNGNGSNRLYGGISNAWMIVKEFA